MNIDPPFLIGDVQRCTFTFNQFTHLSSESSSNLQGNEQLVDIDLGEDIRLKSWQFIEDFKVEIELEPVENAPYGEHEISVTLINRFGEFEGKGLIFVF